MWPRMPPRLSTATPTSSSSARRSGQPEDDPNLIADNLDWLEGYHAAMQPYLSGGAYQNFPDRTQADWPRAYYGENFPRLVEVKRTWDPDNLFRFPQSIPITL